MSTFKCCQGYDEHDRDCLAMENKRLMEAVEVASEAAHFYRHHADCRRETGISICRCAFCRNEQKYRNYLEKIRALVKGGGEAGE